MKVEGTTKNTKYMHAQLPKNWLKYSSYVHKYEKVTKI